MARCLRLSGPEPVKCEDLNYKELIVIKGRLFAATTLLAVAGCAEGEGLTEATRQPEISSPSLVVSPPGKGAGAARTKTYTVTVENLTGGQPLTPPTGEPRESSAWGRQPASN